MVVANSSIVLYKTIEELTGNCGSSSGGSGNSGGNDNCGSSSDGSGRSGGNDQLFDCVVQNNRRVDWQQ